MVWDATEILPARAGLAAQQVGMAASVAGVSRRREQRRRVYKGATIKFNGGFCALQCVVVDLSPSGARLAFGDTVGIPQNFEIRLLGESRWRRAEVRWRRQEALGVALSPAA